MLPDPLIPLLVVSPIILAGAWTDLRLMRIPDALVIMALFVFAASAPFLGWQDTSLRLFGGVCAFVLCFALFGFRIIGGGDAKLFPVLVLFIPPAVYAEFMLVFGISLGVSMAALLTLRRMTVTAGSLWKGFARQSGIPMGVAFALATVSFLGLAYAGV